MKSFLPIVMVTLIFSFSVIAFVHFFTFKNSHKTRKVCDSNSSYTSLLPTKDGAKSKLLAVDKANDSMHGKCKCPDTINDRNAVSFATTELTLEYIAVQSIRSYSFE